MPRAEQKGVKWRRPEPELWRQFCGELTHFVTLGANDETSRSIEIGASGTIVEISWPAIVGLYLIAVEIPARPKLIP